MIMVWRLWRIARGARMLVVAGLAAVAIAGCTPGSDGIPAHQKPLSSAMKQLIASKGMAETSPILVRIFKEESALEVWKEVAATGRFELLKTYEICAWSGELGPKLKEGDRQAPEGFYTVTPSLMNPNSAYHLSFNLGFPNAFDRAHGRTGSFLMVHGACSSAGCYAMEDDQIEEIYALARLAFQGGQRSFQVQAFPFRMTPENMARHRDNPNMEFWRMLKAGHDHFEVTRLPPKIDVCSRQYVFNAAAQNGGRFDPTSACPRYKVPEAIRVAVEEKAARDQAKKQLIVARLEGESGPQSTPPEPISHRQIAAMATPQAPAEEAQAPVAASTDGPPLEAGEAGEAAAATAYAPEPERQRLGFFDRLFNGIR
jgi:murein L,D-transpeptidase YafK